MRIRYSVNDRQLDRAIQIVRRELDKQTILQTIALRFSRWIDQQFRTRGRGEWAPLRPNTIAGRRGGSSAPLQDTGQLRQSFHTHVRNDEVVIGTENPIAIFHQEGTRPYQIRPVNRKVLAFMTTGGMTFARVVNHPGLPARPMVPDEREASRLAQETMDRLADRLEQRANNVRY